MGLDEIFPEIAKEADKLHFEAPRKAVIKRDEHLLRCPDCGHLKGNHRNKGEGNCTVKWCTCDPSRVNNKLRLHK